jgi:hypothetical protein
MMRPKAYLAEHLLRELTPTMAASGATATAAAD